MTNVEVVKYWLGLHMRSNRRILGAVFFDEDGVLSIMNKNGLIEAFVSSPLSSQLQNCLVYLDEAHTRGTDLKLPIGIIAAVTLGPKLAKDKFVQGLSFYFTVCISKIVTNMITSCIRMRKLGKGHKLVFLVPPDTHNETCVMLNKPFDIKLHTKDILV